MDVLAVRAAGSEAVAHCRAGKGPYILEMKTYRYRGHSMSDPAKYRTREEVDVMRKQHDPIDHIKDEMVKAGFDEKKLKDIDADIKKTVSNASDFALNSPLPDPRELWTDVLVEGDAS